MNIKSVAQNLKEKISPASLSTVGLDIGSFSIKAVELKRVNSELELINFTVTHFEKGISRANLSEVIKKTFTDSNFGNALAPFYPYGHRGEQEGTGGNKHPKRYRRTGTRINTSVSGQVVIVRYIQLPQMSEQDLQSAIRFEAEKYIPFKIDEVVLDCRILEKKIGDNKMRVLLVAAKREFIDAHIKLLSDAGLEIQLIDVDSLALINAFQANLPAQAGSTTCALLNIGAKQTNINIIKDGSSCFSRDVMNAGNDLTQVLLEKMNINLLQAEQLKCLPEGKKEEMFNIVQPVLDNLATEVRLSFDYYESQFERGIDKLYLSGGSCSLAGIDKFLADSLGVDVEVWDPLTALRISPEIDQARLFGVRTQLAIAIGLAIRGEFCSIGI